MCLSFWSFYRHVTVELPVPLSVNPFWHTAFLHQFYNNSAQFVVVTVVIVTRVAGAAAPLLIIQGGAEPSDRAGHLACSVARPYCTRLFPEGVPERPCVLEAYHDYSRTQTSHC
jgi:hypothetical protein